MKKDVTKYAAENYGKFEIILTANGSESIVGVVYVKSYAQKLVDEWIGMGFDARFRSV